MNKQEQIRQLKETIEESKRQVEELEREEEVNVVAGTIVDYGWGPRLVVFDMGEVHYVDFLAGSPHVRHTEKTTEAPNLLKPTEVLADSLEEYYREKFKKECEKVYADFFGWVSSADTPSQGDYYKL